MDLKLPPLGEGADSGTVVNLFVKEGDQLAVNQPILELENEKAVATIPSTAEGVVAKVHVKPGDKLSVGQRILTLSGGKGDAPAKGPRPAAKSKAAPKSEAEPAEPAESEESHEEAPAEANENDQTSAEPAASPSLRKMARELGLDLKRVRGTARGGRITTDDLRAYIQRLQKTEAKPKASGTGAAPAGAAERIDFAKWGPVRKQPFTSLRQVIARRMSESVNTIPHVTQFDEADITGLLALRKKYVDAYEKKGARLTVTSFVLKAVVETLKRHPLFNASLDEASQEIVFKEYFHIGIAVDTEAGLIVPVLRDVDKKDLVQISKDLESLATRARERKVAADELKGGTFTISNQGGIGGAQFTPIINKPEVAILGMGKGSAKAVVRDNRIEPRTLLPLALSYDHRVADGANAARFIVDLVKAIETFDEKAVQI